LHDQAVQQGGEVVPVGQDLWIRHREEHTERRVGERIPQAQDVAHPDALLPSFQKVSRRFELGFRERAGAWDNGQGGQAPQVMGPVGHGGEGDDPSEVVRPQLDPAADGSTG